MYNLYNRNYIQDLHPYPVSEQLLLMAKAVGNLILMKVKAQVFLRLATHLKYYTQLVSTHKRNQPVPDYVHSQLTETTLL